MAYAEHTKVPVESTKTEIERTLTKYGADRFAYFVEARKAMIVFEANGRRLRFDRTRAAGPDYPGEWDGVRKVQVDRICRWTASLFTEGANL